MNALRIGLGIAVAFSVLAHGTVEPWSEAVLALLAAFLLLVWAAMGRREIHLNPLLLPLLGLVLIALVQWVFGLSLYPHATRVEWMKLTTLAVLVFLAVQVFRHTSDFRPFVWFLLCFGFVVAVFGIVQSFTFNGKLYWFRELRESSAPFGPYVNRNHFAGLMELIAPLGLAVLLHRGVPRDQLPLVGLFSGISIAALLLSASRGGALSFAFQLVLLSLLVWVRPVSRRAIAIVALVLVLTGGFAVWLGVAQAFQRFRGGWSEEIGSGRRWVIVKDTWRIFQDYPAFGTGAGTYATVYPRYESFYDGKVVNHAHNDYVELLAEMGLAGAACGVAFVVLLAGGALPRLDWTRCSFAASARVGALVACAGLLLHSLVDFNLHIPSNALLFLLCAVMATSPESHPAVLAPRAERG